jgi:hypothetical protein
MPLAKRTFGSLADRGEGLRQKIVELGAVREPLAENLRLAAKLVVA